MSQSSPDAGEIKSYLAAGHRRKARRVILRSCKQSDRSDRTRPAARRSHCGAHHKEAKGSSDQSRGSPARRSPVEKRRQIAPRQSRAAPPREDGASETGTVTSATDPRMLFLRSLQRDEDLKLPTLSRLLRALREPRTRTETLRSTSRVCPPAGSTSHGWEPCFSAAEVVHLWSFQQTPARRSCSQGKGLRHSSCSGHRVGRIRARSRLEWTGKALKHIINIDNRKQ